MADKAFDAVSDTESKATETTQVSPTDEGGSVRDTEASRSAARSRVVRFVVSFVVLVFVFLLGYRYAMDTRANIWYLFQVARHTTWVLSMVGDEAELEPGRQDPGGVKREKLAMWRGEAPADSSQSAGAPLNAYDAWQYKALSQIAQGQTIAEDGPTVRFVRKEGLAGRRASLQHERTVTERDPKITREERQARLQQIDGELAHIEQTLAGFEDTRARFHAQQGNRFSFRVVPDCGAIPSMSIFLAAVLAFPTLLWKRAIGAVGGLFALYWINILRLATLAYIGAVDRTEGQRVFTFVHEYVWQGIFIIFVVIVWMLWVEFVVRYRRT